MQEEIKEILDYLKIENGTIGSELSYEETHLLLDYITNLQEENERLNMVVTIQEDYRSRNEKAIEYIKEKQELTDIDEVINTTELLNILGDNNE